jgi:hypothetical protein
MTASPSYSRSVSTSAALGDASIASTAPSTRRGALLRALRPNPAILRLDPVGEERLAMHFATRVDAAGWVAAEIEIGCLSWDAKQYVLCVGCVPSSEGLSYIG